MTIIDLMVLTVERLKTKDPKRQSVYITKVIDSLHYILNSQDLYSGEDLKTMYVELMTDSLSMCDEERLNYQNIYIGLKQNSTIPDPLELPTNFTLIDPIESEKRYL
jgi:hypothetical protein